MATTAAERHGVRVKKFMGTFSMCSQKCFNFVNALSRSHYRVDSLFLRPLKNHSSACPMQLTRSIYVFSTAATLTLRLSVVCLLVHSIYPFMKRSLLLNLKVRALHTSCCYFFKFISSPLLCLLYAL